MMYVVNSKGDCMTSNTVPIQHLRSEQEEADTCMLLHGLDATKRGETSTFIQSQDTDVLQGRSQKKIRTDEAIFMVEFLPSYLGSL